MEVCMHVFKNQFYEMISKIWFSVSQVLKLFHSFIVASCLKGRCSKAPLPVPHVKRIIWETSYTDLSLRPALPQFPPDRIHLRSAFWAPHSAFFAFQVTDTFTLKHSSKGARWYIDLDFRLFFLYFSSKSNSSSFS